MAAPELTPLTTSSDLFKHPLPTVRLLHKQIHAQLEEKNDRLRTLVGGSYRQLMGTAETIVRMRSEIEEAEELLAGVGKGCGRGQVNKMVSGLGSMRRGYGRGRSDAEENEFGRRTRAKVLENCVVVVGRLLRGKGDVNDDSSLESKLVTAAKVLVLSRLLLKSLDETNGEKVEAAYAREIGELRRKLASLRRRLLRAVERRLERVDGDGGRASLLQALCAYSLATSSGARDIMRHFLQARCDAIALIFGEDAEKEEHIGYEENQKGVVKAISLYTKTLLDIQALVPRRLADALAEQKARPLLKNKDVRDLEGLRIDVSERWFGDVILNFTPYIIHDDLDGPTARKMLTEWANDTSDVLLKGFKQSIERVMDFKQVMELRTKTFEMWISEGGKAKGFDSETLLDGLRDVVNTHLIKLLETRVEKLRIIGTEVEGALGGWSAGSVHHSSLWTAQMLDMEISNGATKFKSAVLDCSHGRNDAVSRVTNSYRTWRHLIEEVTGVVEQLKKQRWDDDMEDIEDEDSVENRQDLLSTQDPATLRKHLDDSLTSSFQSLHGKLQAILKAHEDNRNKTAFAIFLLRVLREIRADLPDLEALKSFGLSIIPQLHDTLVKSIIEEPTSALAKSFHRRKVIGKLLWEGEPALPVQPSPSIFKFVHNLSSTMAARGSDLWSPTAILVLKKNLRSEIGRLWNEAIGARNQEKAKVNGSASTVNGVAEDEHLANGSLAEDEHMANGHGEDNSTPRPKDDDGLEDDLALQGLFDVLVLGLFLELSKDAGEDELNGLEKSLKMRLNLDSSAHRQLQQSSLEYWKRTNLMFGLLM